MAKSRRRKDRLAFSVASALLFIAGQDLKDWVPDRIPAYILTSPKK